MVAYYAFLGCKVTNLFINKQKKWVKIDTKKGCSPTKGCNLNLCNV